MGTRNFIGANSRAGWADMQVLPEEFWLPRRNKLFSLKSDDEVRLISVDCRPVTSSVDGMATKRIPLEVRQEDRLFDRADFRGAGFYRSVFTIEIKGRTSKQALILLLSREMAS
jgi:hypothetical protein